MAMRAGALGVFSAICAFIAFAILFQLYFQHDLGQVRYLFGGQIESPDWFTAPKQNIWAELTQPEANEVYDFVFEEFASLNLTKRPRSNADNYILAIESLRPNKTDAVSYINNDARLPERWAKVTISQNFEDGPYMLYYSIGPLPVSSRTQVLPLDYIFNSGRNYVRNPILNLQSLLAFGLSLVDDISDITENLLEHSGDPNPSSDPYDGLLCWPRNSVMEHGRWILWYQIFRPGIKYGARTLLPQGIYAKVDATSANPADWFIGQYYYNGIIYSDVNEFRAAIDDPDFQRTPPNLDGEWTQTEDFHSHGYGRGLPPPLAVQPYGSRYKLDRKQQFVSWFGFEFFISTAPATGVSLFDIRFKGDRVIYELGLQEALSHYAGDDPLQGGLEFLDTFLGMGQSMFELVPGYDCPAYADYLDVRWHQLNESNVNTNAICVFEFTADHLLSRHTAQYSVTASRNTYLVVRSVSTVGNYDYTIEYIFYMDGTLETKVRASGFIFAAFHTANNTKSEDEYGHRVHDAVSTSMHDHVINFKADMDVAGASNDMVRLAVEPLTASYPWDHPEIKTRNTMHLVEYAVTEETGLDWPRNSGELYIVYNSEKKNAWGERRGYRLVPGTGVASPIHLTIVNSTTLGSSARWAEHDLWVLQHKDNEPRSADPLNYFSPNHPLIDFNKMAKNETLVHDDPESSYDGDLVVYFNLGGHHIPHSGDIPNTLMHTSASSIMFIPHNFNDRDPSRASVQGVRLELKGKNSGGFAGEESARGDLKNRLRVKRESEEKHHARYFGSTYGKGMRLRLGSFEPDLQKYQSREHGVSYHDFNGSAAGAWVNEEAP